jgi:predicted PurR-regulated permease PerM
LLQPTNQSPIEPEAHASAHESFIKIAARLAIIGIFILLFGAFLQTARVLVLPIVCAFLIGMMLSPLARRAETYRVPAPVFAVLADILFLVLIQFALAAVVAPIVTVAAHAAEVGDNLRQKFAALYPLLEYARDFENKIMPGASSTFDSVTALAPEVNLTNALQPVAAFLTPGSARS